MDRSTNNLWINHKNSLKDLEKEHSVILLIKKREQK